MIETVLLKPIHMAFCFFMLLASFLSIYSITCTASLSERIAVAGSFGNKMALLILAFGIFRNDWMIGSVGAVILIAGDAGMLILALTELKE
ncbi:hypothetical protein N9U66_02830 [Synechococcus sp. AH-736-M20]|nr:hypothetical protein [Synechococcus sp. AH-736-M20]|tara:strand:- start:205 stop:477 length:273 start_codon:yes stop_codon:yes gene_type:complete